MAITIFKKGERMSNRLKKEIRLKKLWINERKEKKKRKQPNERD